MLGAEHDGRLRLVRLDIDANLRVPGRYGVLSLPTVILFSAGEPVEVIHGAQPKRHYADAVERRSPRSPGRAWSTLGSVDDTAVVRELLDAIRARDRRASPRASPRMHASAP